MYRFRIFIFFKLSKKFCQNIKAQKFYVVSKYNISQLVDINEV